MLCLLENFGPLYNSSLNLPRRVRPDIIELELLVVFASNFYLEDYMGTVMALNEASFTLKIIF